MAFFSYLNTFEDYFDFVMCIKRVSINFYVYFKQASAIYLNYVFTNNCNLKEISS